MIAKLDRIWQQNIRWTKAGADLVDMGQGNDRWADIKITQGSGKTKAAWPDAQGPPPRPRSIHSRTIPCNAGTHITMLESIWGPVLRP